jgi:hypothetical protein
MFSNHYSAVKVQTAGLHPERSKESQFEMLDCDHNACLAILRRQGFGGFSSIFLPLRGIHFEAKKNTQVVHLLCSVSQPKRDP